MFFPPPAPPAPHHSPFHLSPHCAPPDLCHLNITHAPFYTCSHLPHTHILPPHSDLLLPSTNVPSPTFTSSHFTVALSLLRTKHP